MGLFDGKRLLELGSNISSVDIIKYAKKEGAYVIVSDYLPIDKSEAKKYADESYMISTLDTDSLVDLVLEKSIDGVICGVSEINLQSVKEIAFKTGLPCYFTTEQWELCENKAIFKEFCKKYSVPVAKEYCLSDKPTEDELKKVEYPVIVKPVDLCASRGIHICRNEEELLCGYKDASKKSPSHKVIVEKFLSGDEISATYSFVNGECQLSMLSQMFYNLEQKGLVPLPDAYIYPSKHLSKFLKVANKPIIEMLKSLGLKNGSVFISGIANENEFAFFEAGLRLAGTAPYRFVSSINGINIMELITEYSINGNISKPELVHLEDPYLKGKKCCLYSLLNRGGTISKIIGYDEAAGFPGVVSSTIQRKVGDFVEKDGTLGQVNVRFYIIKDNIDEICDVINRIQKTVKVIDEQGNNMLLESNIISQLQEYKINQ